MALMNTLALRQVRLARTRSLSGIVGIAIATMSTVAVVGVADNFITATTALDADLGLDLTVGPVIALAVTVSAFVALVASVVIANVFRMSAAARTAQFGVLKSVGATKRQIRATMRAEAFYLALVGIPIGILLGTALQAVVVVPTTRAFTNFFGAMGVGTELHVAFHPSWLAAVVGLLLSAITVYLAIRRPAKKASNTSAIAAIRGHDDAAPATVKAKSYRVTSAIFGFDGLLAARNIHRSRREFRSLIATLAIVIILAQVSTTLVRILSEAARSVDFNTTIDYEHNFVQGVNTPVLSNEEFNRLNSTLKDQPGMGEFIGLGIAANQFRVQVPVGILTTEAPAHWDVPENGTGTLWVHLLSLDEMSYAQLVRATGLPGDSYLLVNRFVGPDDFGGFVAVNNPIAPWAENPGNIDLIPVGTDLAPDLSQPAIPIAIGGILPDFPGLEFFNSLMSRPAGMILIAPPGRAPLADFTSAHWASQVEDAQAFLSAAQVKIGEGLPACVPGSSLTAPCTIWYSDLTATSDALRAISSAALWGLITLLGLICLTSLISTVASSITSRKGEFAILRSPGITEPDLRRMLLLEMVFTTSRALLIGLPIGLLAGFLLDRAASSATQLAHTHYVFPWLATLIVIAGIIAVTILITYFAAVRVKRNNIIETIRAGSLA
ncbi:MAG: ABC transporter permease [Promicromonosporaceae bacterium]|nr:ABC transporter permease [Promicromonosporaceae bacterium]